MDILDIMIGPQFITIYQLFGKSCLLALNGGSTWRKHQKKPPGIVSQRSWDLVDAGTIFEWLSHLVNFKNCELRPSLDESTK
jgi:hypothetical protein